MAFCTCQTRLHSLVFASFVKTYWSEFLNLENHVKENKKMSGGTSCLSITVSVIGVLFAACSVTGIAMSLFLIFGDPLPPSISQNTDEPNWEDIGNNQRQYRIIFKFRILIVGWLQKGKFVKI